MKTYIKDVKHDGSILKLVVHVTFNVDITTLQHVLLIRRGNIVIHNTTVVIFKVFYIIGIQNSLCLVPIPNEYLYNYTSTKCVKSW